MIVASAQTAAELLAPLVEPGEAETLAIAYLDRRHRLLGIGRRTGGEGELLLPMRAILAEGMRLEARSLIIGHNHPSGDPSPSAADIAATRTLAATARALDLTLADHLIFASGCCRSFRQLGLL